MIFDDIHWAEQIFLDLIGQVAGISHGVPLLILCAARHELVEEHPGFLAGRDGAHMIELHELSAATWRGCWITSSATSSYLRA